MLGIIGAMPAETAQLVEEMEEREERERAGLHIFRGRLWGVPAAVTCAGVGKVNAAMCAQISQ